jgi:predicted O-methyltransferase YrrM
MSARANKHTYISKGLSEYINHELSKSELPIHIHAMKSLEKGERSYLQVPLSEARFLENLIKVTKTKNVLEIGTFRGFSTAFLARALPEDGIVFTCDEDTRYVSAARRFWEALGVDEKIHFELDLATRTLERLVQDEPTLDFFDFVFIDADKENYRIYVEQSMKLLKEGGIMMIDNTLWKGLVEFKDPYDNGAKHMQEFNSWVFDTYGRDACLIPGWDGLTMIYKR